MKYDVVLIEKENCRGLTKTEATNLYDILSKAEGLPETEGYPVEIMGCEVESSAMGFITPQAAEKLLYEYGQDSGFGEFITVLLDDVDVETGAYEYNGLNIWLGRYGYVLPV